jgi:hypothetical protein
MNLASPARFIRPSGSSSAVCRRRSQAARVGHGACLEFAPSTAKAQSQPQQEPTMTRHLSTRVAAFSLSVLVTISVLLGLNGLASPEHATVQFARAVAAQPV